MLNTLLRLAASTAAGALFGLGLAVLAGVMYGLLGLSCRRRRPLTVRA